MPKRLLVTGAAGLIGAEVCRLFGRKGFEIHGVDHSSPPGSVAAEPDVKRYELDIRNRDAVVQLVRDVKPYGIVHAAQTWHDREEASPVDHFDINAVGTLNVLEGARRFAPDCPFIHLSSRQVYGDRPNTVTMREAALRWEFSHPAYAVGISEDFPMDHSTHTPFGASKVAADILVQEYGRYYHLPSCCLRLGSVAGCGPECAAPHGFLSRIVQCNLEAEEYKILGYKGKQVRDCIHAEDVAQFIYGFYEQPRIGEVYNLGGGRVNSCSILEAFRLVEKCTGKPMRQVYLEKNRIGDTICYYSDMRKIENHYPQWELTKSLEQIVSELVEAEKARR